MQSLNYVFLKIISGFNDTVIINTYLLKFCSNLFRLDNHVFFIVERSVLLLHLESLHLLELGDLEGAVGVAALGLEVKDLLLLLLDLSLHAPLLGEHLAALLIELHAQSGEVIWIDTAQSSSCINNDI